MISRMLVAPGGSFFPLGPRGTGKSTWVAGLLPRAWFVGGMLCAALALLGAGWGLLRLRRRAGR